MIKAAFFDIDGTLLSFKTHRVSEGTIRAFDRLHRAGVRTFLSTGRPPVLIPEMPVSFDGTISMNGGFVYTPDNIIARHPIASDEGNAWLDYAERNRLCTMVFTQDSMFLAQPNDIGRQIRDQLEFTMPPTVEINQMRDQTIFQIIAVMTPDRDTEVQALLPHCRLPRWHPRFTDIVAHGNSKSHGMSLICQHFGIRQEETIAFGDGGNDIDMLQWAGTGIAMGNADDTVKAAADMVTSDVDNEGIEHAINHLLP